MCVLSVLFAVLGDVRTGGGRKKKIKKRKKPAKGLLFFSNTVTCIFTVFSWSQLAISNRGLHDLNFGKRKCVAHSINITNLIFKNW